MSGNTWNGKSRGASLILHKLCNEVLPLTNAPPHVLSNKNMPSSGNCFITPPTTAIIRAYDAQRFCSFFLGCLRIPSVTSAFVLDEICDTSQPESHQNHVSILLFMQQACSSVVCSHTALFRGPGYSSNNAGDGPTPVPFPLDAILRYQLADCISVRWKLPPNSIQTGSIISIQWVIFDANLYNGLIMNCFDNACQYAVKGIFASRRVSTDKNIVFIPILNAHFLVTKEWIEMFGCYKDLP
jgi:hypothetical protein